MKKLVKVALGAVAFLGITELFCVETVAIMWREPTAFMMQMATPLP